MEEASEMWERMNKLNSVRAGPEFLSTHPSNKNRIKNINSWIPIIKREYSSEVM